MQLNLGLQPFKDFWINCDFNMIFSLLISLEPSYKLAPYLNNYSYGIFEIETPPKTMVNYLKVIPFQDFFPKYFGEFPFSIQAIDFKNDLNYLEYLKGLIKQREWVMVGVDLFYWIPMSVCWDKHHWEHYSLITGFNDEKKIFYVFDENNCGFDEYEISEERFCMAIKNSPLEPHGYVYKLSKSIGKFELSINEVAYYAEQLMKELEILNSESLWCLRDEDFVGEHMRDLFAMYIFQIVNRHKANELLFKVVSEKGLINNPKTVNTLIQYCQELQKGWTLVKNKFIKLYSSNSAQSDIIDINEKCRSLFNTEYGMWNKFLTYTKK